MSATWVNAREAAELLGVSLRTLSRLDAQGVTKPTQLTPGARRRYNLADIEALLSKGSAS